MIRIGVIGLGGAGRAHVNRFRRNQAVGEIVGYDIKQPISKVADEILVNSLEELLDRVDAVSICTPDHCHAGEIKRCLESGKHVLVEKPMVASQAEASELEAVIESHRHLVFGVHHQMRQAEPFRKAAQLIQDGTLGKIFYLEANYWHDMRSRSVKYDNWRVETGQSLLFGHACHPFDLMMHLVGQSPVSHSTYLSKNGFPEYAAAYTSSTTVMGFADNIIGKCHVNSCCEFPQFNNLIVMGDKGTYIDGVLCQAGQFSQVSNFFGEGSKKLSLNVVDIKVPPVFVSLTLNVYLKVMNWVSKALMSHPDYGFRQYPFTVYNHDGACQSMIDNFVAAIQGREKILVGFKEAERVIRLCEETERDGLSRMRD